MARLPLIRDHMDKRAITLRPETNIVDAVRFLLRHRVTGAPVVDGKGHLLGLLTERECMAIVSKGVGGDAPHGTVEEFMSTDVRTVPPEMDVYYAAGLFLNESVRRFPVIEDGKVIGVITRFDLLRVIEPRLKR